MKRHDCDPRAAVTPHRKLLLGWPTESGASDAVCDRSRPSYGRLPGPTRPSTAVLFPTPQTSSSPLPIHLNFPFPF